MAPTISETPSRDAGSSVIARRAMSAGRPRCTAMRTAGRNSEGVFNPWAVRQNSIPASFNMEALLGASSQCFSSVKDIKRAKNRSLRS